MALPGGSFPTKQPGLEAMLYLATDTTNAHPYNVRHRLSSHRMRVARHQTDH